MRAFLVFLLLVGWIIFARYDFVCRIMNRCGDDVNNKENVIDIERTKDLDFVADDSVLFSGYDQFAFQEYNIEPILNANNEEYLTRVYAYLNGKPQSQMTIKGFYKTSESDSTAGIYENLGLARADAIRRWFTQKGMDENRIGLDSDEDTSNTLSRPLAFSAVIPARPDEYDIEVKPKYTFTNMTFSDITFEYDSDKFDPSGNNAFELYMDSMQVYLNLEDNKEKTIVIIGHTDNKGTPKYNMKLGHRRSKEAKKYIIENFKIPKNRISTDSKGQEEPIADNNEDAGREKNRRVNILVKE
jgi:outer membrane protein OmpA-like peptidoglycan-associated protein